MLKLSPNTCTSEPAKVKPDALKQHQTGRKYFANQRAQHVRSLLHTSSHMIQCDSSYYSTYSDQGVGHLQDHRLHWDLNLSQQIDRMSPMPKFSPCVTPQADLFNMEASRPFTGQFVPQVLFRSDCVLFWRHRQTDVPELSRGQAVPDPLVGEGT